MTTQLIETTTRELTHFIGGQHVTGTSNRFSDVFDPNTGEVQARVPLASDRRGRGARSPTPSEAQLEWATWNPQHRARVLHEVPRPARAGTTVARASCSPREHGKTVADATGDIQRGLEVIEFAVGAPHLLKGEYSTAAGTGIDVYSMRQPLGVVAGITPFNFPAMIPLWKCGPALAAGNAFILKPSERDPSVPLRIAELFLEAGLPAGVLNVVNGDKEAVDALLHRRPRQGGRLRRLHPDRAVHLRDRGGQRQACAVLRRRQEPHDRHAGRRPRPGRRRPHRRRLRLGR